MTEAAGNQWVQDYWENVVPIVASRLSSHGKPFIGGTDRPTIADFKAFAHVSTGTDLNPASLVPVAIHQRVNAIIARNPAYAHWIENMKSE